jgi:hypothetical protein
MLWVACLWGQSDNTTVNGIVKDPTAAVVPNAKIALKSETTGLLRQTQSSDSGVFVIPAVPPGMYTLNAEAPGFKKYESRNNKVDPSMPASFEVVLQVGAASETVEVVATASALQTESGAVGRLVEGRQISDLQLNGRNPIFLALLKPGVRSGNTLASFSFAMSNGSLSINGSRVFDNVVMHDGAPAVRTRANGLTVGAVDLDMTAEVQILTASYAAEYGRGAGGQLRVVTKSGTSKFHGSLYEYIRNPVFDANSWDRNLNRSTSFVAPYTFNQFGYNFAGPIFIPGKFNSDRSKLFFMWAQEWVRYPRAAGNNRTVPTAAMRTGDFSQLLGANSFFSSPQIIRDPTTGSPFSGNVIPKSRLSSNGMGLLNVYPLPNLAVPLGTSNYYDVASATTDQRKDSVSLDYLPTSKDSIKVRGLLYHYLDVDPWATNFRLSDKTFDRPNQTASVNWTRTIGPTLVNEFLVTASRDQVYIAMTDTPTFDRTRYGIVYPYIYPDGKDRPNKLPAIDVAGFTSYTGSPYPSKSSGPIYTISDNITKVRGSHILKAGFLFDRAGENDYDQINVSGVPGGTDNQNGRFVFSNARTGGSGVAIGNVALGLFDSYAEIGKRSYTPYRRHMYEWFVQDSWKVSPKLKFEFGVRHTIIIPYHSLWNNIIIFDEKYYDPAKAMKVDPSNGNPIAGSGDPYNGLVIPGNGWPSSAKGRVNIAGDSTYDYLFRGGAESRHYSDVGYLNFQPRVGIAYQLGAKSVLRAGAGKFTTPIPVSDGIFLGGNPPLQPIASVAYGSVDQPGGGSKASFPLSVTTQSRYLPMPQSYTWNLTYEREVGFNTVVELGYVGRRGVDNIREVNINQAPINSVYTNPRVNVNAMRPYLGYGPIRRQYDNAKSRYNGLQLSVNRRFLNGLSYGLAYTYSKCMDDGSDKKDLIPDSTNATYLWGPCTMDTRHLMVINTIYELPFMKHGGNGLLRAVAGGWQVTLVSQMQTGAPTTIASGDDFAGVGPGSGSQIWQVNGDPQLDRGSRAFANSAGENAYWFRTTTADGKAMFTRPANGTFITQYNRDLIYNPGLQNWNLGLFKTFTIHEQHRLLLRGEAFNFLNHPNWGGAGTSPTSATLGKVTSKSGNRNIQLSLRYSF